MRCSLHAVAILLLAATGCEAGRAPNRLLVAGARVLATRGAHEGGFSGAVAAAGAAEFVSADRAVGGSYQASVALGGNPDDVVAEARLAASMGAQIDPTIGRVRPKLHTIHMRVGVEGMIETSAYERIRYAELPNLSAGYTFHGQNTQTYADSMHLHIGPRVALAVAGAASDGEHVAAFDLAPAVGGEVVFAGEAVWISGSYRAFLTAERFDFVEGRGCFARLFAACVEARYVILPWATRAGAASTLYVGLTLGLGESTGVERAD